MQNPEWFKEEFRAQLAKYKVEEIYEPEGDFGSLNQIRFDNKERGGAVDFWSSGDVYINIFDYATEKVLINLHLDPHQLTEKQSLFEQLKQLL